MIMLPKAVTSVALFPPPSDLTSLLRSSIRSGKVQRNTVSATVPIGRMMMKGMR